MVVTVDAESQPSISHTSTLEKHLAASSEKDWWSSRRSRKHRCQSARSKVPFLKVRVVVIFLDTGLLKGALESGYLRGDPFDLLRWKRVELFEIFRRDPGDLFPGFLGKPLCFANKILLQSQSKLCLHGQPPT